MTASPGTAVVTGGTGFIGANLVRRLLDDGWRVELLARPGHATWRLPDPAADAGVHIVDITDETALGPLMKRLRARCVFHLAAYGAYSWQTDAARIMSTNYLGTRTLALCAVAAGVEVFVHAGSSAEYGRLRHAPSEDDRVEPESDYAISKAAATHFCRQLARRENIPMPTLRLYSAYGPWEEPRRLVPALLVRALDGEWPRLASPATARDFVWVGDVVEGFVRATQFRLSDPGAVINIGTGRQTTLSEIVTVAGELLGVHAEPPWESFTSRAWDTDIWCADVKKLQRELSWAPTMSLRDGLERTVAWLKADLGRLAAYRDMLRGT